MSGPGLTRDGTGRDETRRNGSTCLARQILGRERGQGKSDCFLRCRFFRVFFCAISAFFLYGEYFVRSFLPNGVYLPCDHGLDF